MEKQIVYIAGKITGDENYIDKFKKVSKKLEKLGFIVLNPSVLPKGMTNANYMKICFAMIDCSECVMFIEDYTDSKGAMLEKVYCDYIKKPYSRITV